MKYLFLSLLVLVPGAAFAQGLIDWIPSLFDYLFRVIIPFLLGASFLVVTINVVRFFVIGSTNEEGREKAKAYVIYSILAFIFVIIFWGLVNLLANATGLQGSSSPTPDYLDTGGAGGTTGSNPACDAPASPDDFCICFGPTHPSCIMN